MHSYNSYTAIHLYTPPSPPTFSFCPQQHSYAAHSGLAQIWADYCRRVKAPVLAMRDDPVRMADPGIAQVRPCVCARTHCVLVYNVCMGGIWLKCAHTPHVPLLACSHAPPPLHSTTIYK